MDDMIEIAQLIINVGIKRPDSFLTDGDSVMMTAFFNGLVNGEFHDDDGAAKKLYNTTSKDERYRQLKSRLREKLYDASVFIDFTPPKFSTLRQKMYECNREQTAMKQCIENGAQDAGYIIAKRLLKKARKYHLTIVEIECLYVILNHVIAFTGNHKEYLNVCSELRNAQQALNAETEAEILYGSVSVKYAVTGSDHPENAPFVTECIRQLELILTKHDTFKIRYSYFILRSLLGQIQRDFESRIQSCEDAIEYFKLYPEISGNLPAVFTLEKIECYFHLRDYSSCFTLAKECEHLFLKNSSNWVKIKRYEVQSLLSIGEPIRALEIFTVVQKAMKKGGGVKKSNNQWLLLEGYIYFFLHTEKQEILPEIFQPPPLEYYMRKLLTTELTSLTGDKEGSNAGLMILHVLLLLCLKSNPADIAEKVVALDRYKRRYLDQDANSRTNIFITMLRHFTFENFDMRKTGIKTENLFLKLLPSNTTTVVSTEDYELIPFDTVWQRILRYYGVMIRV